MNNAKILWATSGELPAGWPILSHAHSFYHFFYILSGKATFLLDGVLYNVNENQAIIAAPGVRHEIPAEPHSILEICEIKFSVNDPSTIQALNSIGPVCSGDHSYMKTTLQNIVYCWSMNDTTHQANANFLLNALLISLQIANNKSVNQVSNYIDTTSYPELIKRIIGYIEKNHMDPFSLEQLASHLGYNKRYLCTAFKQSTGITILEFLNHIRIRHATKHIYYNDVPISVIAQYVGFITPVHFTRVFKKLVGISPMTFRQIHNLRNIDISEDIRLKTPQLSIYEQILGENVLPLERAIASLKELGDFALHQQENNS